MRLTLLLMWITMVMSWDYLMFVQYWPGTWIAQDHVTNSGFTNNYFNVHGIWPENDNGTYPAYCQKHAHFDPSVLKLIWSDLTTYWTDYENAPDFWKHEYLKHGTCAASDPILATELEFFSAGLSLRQTYDLYQILTNNNIYPSNEQSYDTTEILNTVSQAIGTNVALTCDDTYDDNSLLDEIIICLDANLNPIDCPNSLNQCSSSSVYLNVINS